jgi:acylphosphatase
MGTVASRLSVRGRVQMVGYRRYVMEAAREAGLFGYVKNEADGSVTILAQGEERKLKAVLERLRAPLSRRRYPKL